MRSHWLWGYNQIGDLEKDHLLLGMAESVDLLQVVVLVFVVIFSEPLIAVIVLIMDIDILFAFLCRLIGLFDRIGIRVD